MLHLFLAEFRRQPEDLLRLGIGSQSLQGFFVGIPGGGQPLGLLEVTEGLLGPGSEDAVNRPSVEAFTLQDFLQFTDLVVVQRMCCHSLLLGFLHLRAAAS